MAISRRYREEGASLSRVVNACHLGVCEHGVAGVAECAVFLLLGASVPVCPDVGRASACLVPCNGPDRLGPSPGPLQLGI